MPRSLLAEIGLPDRTFYLYGDDNEFTARSPRAQARLLLVPGSLVSDADEVTVVFADDRRYTAEVVGAGEGDGDTAEAGFTIVDAVLLDDGEFDVLEAAVLAVEEAGILPAATLLSSDGAFTVFAPTDKAFAKLAEDLGDGVVQHHASGRIGRAVDRLVLDEVAEVGLVLVTHR